MEVDHAREQDNCEGSFLAVRGFVCNPYPVAVGNDRWFSGNASSGASFQTLAWRVMILQPGNVGFSEPQQLTQRKSNRLIENFVCNPLLRDEFWV